MPHVSVIVPNYNYSKYLHLRIDSILSQTYQDFELILLDDKSTDDSANVLNEYSKNPHVSHIIINEQNSGGVFYQWEKGISLAKGDYIWIAEADDYAEPTFLEKCVNVLEPDTELVLCQTGSKLVDSEGNCKEGNWDRFCKSDGKVLTFKSEEYIKKYLRHGNPLYNASGIVFRKSAVGEFPQEVKSYRASGDWLFWLLLVQKGDVAIIKERLNVFRRHTQSASHTTPVKENIMIFRYLLEKGIYEGVNSHSCLISQGVLQRQIKHIRDYANRAIFWQQLQEVTHRNSKLPYHYSQFCKFLNRLSPICLFPPTRKY